MESCSNCRAKNTAISFIAPRPDDKDEISLIENIQREDLKTEEARHQRLIDKTIIHMKI